MRCPRSGHKRSVSATDLPSSAAVPLASSPSCPAHLLQAILKTLANLTRLLYLRTVADVLTSEFPGFAEAYPKREKSKLARLWDMVSQMTDATSADGMLIPLSMAAKLLDLSRSRVDDIVRDGRLRRVTIDSHAFITENSIREFASVERKAGRPVKVGFKEK
jgi:hypothetical protein